MDDRRINDIVNEPGFERIRSEIKDNLDKRSDESQKAFTGLMTFCGVVYTGATIGILSFIGARSSSGVPYFSIAAFASFAAALVTFAILYQQHSQLIAKRHAHYADVAQRFFLRQATFGEVIEAGHTHTAQRLYRMIFWVPLCFAVLGFALGAFGAVGLGANVPPPEMSSKEKR